MQVGTVFGPVAFGAALLVWRRDVAHAAAVVVGGVSTWFLAKAVKAVVQRQRPAAYLPHIHVRDGNGLGLGFVSGHSAVAACIAVCIMPVVSKPWRWAMATIAGVVGIARIVHGVHLPADVVGGWSLGTLVGLPAWGCVERVHRRISPST
jgi:undecaprenyl-diphosphatase